MLAAMAFSLWSVWGGGLGQATEISYSTFRQHVQNGNVSQVIVEQERIRGMLKEAATKEVEEGEGFEYTEKAVSRGGSSC